MSKKLLSVGVVLALVAAVLVSVPAVSAQTASLCSTVDALVAAGVIAPDKVASAKAAAGCSAMTSSAYVFTKDLTVGSTGADVTALQNKLGVTPATGYFGAFTKAAVMAYQTSKGISATGFVGPLTRAALNYVAPVVVVPSTPSTPSVVLNGSAGSADFSTTTTNVESTVNEGAENTKVLGFKVEASDSDVSVTNLKVTLKNNVTGSESTRIDRYLDSVSVYMGSKKVGTADISDFTKTGTTYTKSIALSNAVVKEGTANKATFYVTVNALSSIDSVNRGADTDVTVSNIRYVDGSGVSTTDTWSQVQNFGYSTLADSGDVKVTISRGSSNPIARNVEVSDTSSTDDVLVLEFKVKAVGSDVTFDTVNFIATTTSTSSPSNLISRAVLKNGSDELATLDGSDLAAWNATSTFNLDDTFTVAEGTTEVFRIYVDVQDASNFTNGDITVKLAGTPNAINAEDSNGDDIEETGSAVGETQSFILNGAVVTYSTESYSAADVGNSVEGRISLTFTVEALGDNDITLAENQTTTENRAAGAGRVSYNVEGTSSVTSAYISSTSESAVSGDYTVSSGDTKTYKLSIGFASSTGQVRLTINSVDGTTVSNIKTTLH